MDCPKCKAKNDDAAAFCSFCYERFVAKPAAAPQTIVIPSVVCEFGYWETEGPLLVTRDALYFFTKRCTDVSEKKNLKKNVHKHLMEKGLLGLALGAALSPAFDDKMPLKPEEVKIKVVHWEKEPLSALAHTKPAIGTCDDYFVIQKSECTGVKTKPFFRFVFSTATAEITTDSIEQNELLGAFLRSSGFPLQ